MLRTALQPRFLGLLALMIAAAVVCSLLATWQWDRAHRALTAKTQAVQDLGDIRDVTPVGGAVTNEISGRIVTARGTYAPGEQVLVTGRSISGEDAVIVVSALVVRQKDGSSARLPVARGWLPAADVAGADGAPDPARAPAPPSGDVEVRGRIEASEAATGGVEHGIAPEIATPMLVNAWGRPMYAGYVAQFGGPDQSPSAGGAMALRELPASGSSFTRGLNLQNLGYALQWGLFAAFFLYLWWRVVRAAHLDELAAHRERVLAMAHPAPGSSPEPAGQSDPEPSEEKTP